jgi:glycosyltransferase involved in cell wall biosynthesis
MAAAAGRRDVMVVGWTRRGDRLVELAEEIGGEARVIFTPRLSARPLIVLRYLSCAALMVVHLVRERPRTVVVVNPPLWPGVIGWLYARLTRSRFLLDSHPGGFGAQGHSLEKRFQWLHRFLVERSDGVLVASPPWVEVVESWGGTARVVHEPPRDRGLSAPKHADTVSGGLHRPVVLFVCIFAPDEPVADVIEAARIRPDCDWWITGDPARAPADVLADAPSNVHLTGYLGPDEFDAALGRADVVLALTTEPTSVMRAAFEAVDARRPLVVSDFSDVTEAFPYAVPTANDGRSIARAVGDIVEDLETAMATTEIAHRNHTERWNRQLAELCELVDGGDRIA